MPPRIPLPFGPDASTLDVGGAHPNGAADPKGVEVSQGFGSNGFTHNDTGSGGIFHFAIDFLLGFGAPVLAQGTGKVIEVVQGVPDGAPASTNGDPSLGTSSIGNFVTVYYDGDFTLPINTSSKKASQ